VGERGAILGGGKKNLTIKGMPDVTRAYKKGSEAACSMRDTGGIIRGRGSSIKGKTQCTQKQGMIKTFSHRGSSRELAHGKKMNRTINRIYTGWG